MVGIIGFIVRSTTIIRYNDLKCRSNSRRSTTNRRDNAQVSHNTITLDLIIQVGIRAIKRSGDGTADDLWSCSRSGTVRSRRQHITIRAISWDRHSHDLLDGDADSDAATVGRSRRRTIAAATVARVRTIATITRIATTIAASVLIHVGRHLFQKCEGEEKSEGETTRRGFK